VALENSQIAQLPAEFTASSQVRDSAINRCFLIDPSEMTWLSDHGLVCVQEAGTDLTTDEIISIQSTIEKFALDIMT
jgi:hypothetical protein